MQAAKRRIMTEMTSLLSNICYQVVAIVFAIFACFLVGKGSRTRVALFFILAVSATALWAQLFVLVQQDVLTPVAYDLGMVTRDGAWLGFCLVLIHALAGDRNYWRLMAAAAAGLIALQLVLVLGLITFGTLAGVPIDIALVRVCTTILGLVLIENVLRNASRADFWALKHWAIGLSAMLVFQLVVRVPEFLTHKPDPGFILASPLVILIALPFLVISSIRLPQLQLRIHSSRVFVFHTATLLGVGILLQGIAFAAWYVRDHGGTNGTALALTALFSGLVGIAAALVSGTVRSRIRLLINQYFFSFKYDYRVEWERAIRGLTAGLDKNVAERALRIFCDLLDTSGGAIWLYQESWRQFVPAGKIGTVTHVGALREDDDRLKLLTREDRPFADCSSGAQAGSAFAVFGGFIDNAWLVLPLRYRSSLAGFVVLNKPRAPRKLDWEDENLVRVLALQVTAYVLQEEMAQSLADARQLEDFNKRFAFIVHDIKNTIGQLSLLVRNIAQFGDQKEFRDDMVITLGNSVERMENLLKGLTAVGAKPTGAAGCAPVDLAGLLEDFVEDKSRLGHAITLNVQDESGPVNTDSVALLRVLEHVVSNAVEASDKATPVEIALRPAGQKIEIVVTDQGTGMTEQFIKEELFRPLRTTKQGGFGVGAYQIRELMRELGGDVAVESAVGKGTRFILFLPRHSAFAPS